MYDSRLCTPSKDPVETRSLWGRAGASIVLCFVFEGEKVQLGVAADET